MTLFSLALLASTAAFAQTDRGQEAGASITNASPAMSRQAGPATARDADYPAPLEIKVDATDLNRRIFRVQERIAVRPGPMTLLYTKWIPGMHAPGGPIKSLAGLIIRANGKVVPWRRDTLDVYAFHLDVPPGADRLDVEFQYLTSQDRKPMGGATVSPDMLRIQLNSVSLYPAGYAVRRIPASLCMTFPAGFEAMTVLDVASRTGDTLCYRTVNYDDLVDSPIYAGRYTRRIDLDPGARHPVSLDIMADAPASLAVAPAQIAQYRAMVQQAYKLFGAHPYDRYDFLLSLSEKIRPIGAESHRSSQNGLPGDYFTHWAKNQSLVDMLTHEFVHSWNGKFRRPADLDTATFSDPMQGSLLWVYEGQTHFWGWALSARAGLWDRQQALDFLANNAAQYDLGHPGLLQWRSIQDTTNDPNIARGSSDFPSYQLDEDYYAGGLLIWLDVDGKLRELTSDRKSLDDFAAVFFKAENGRWDVSPYSYADVVAALDAIAPYDWNAYLRGLLDGHAPLIQGLANHGWKLVYTDAPAGPVFGTREWFTPKGADFRYSIGLNLSEDGTIAEVIWDSPAFKSGIAPNLRIRTVNGAAYSAKALRDAIGGHRPIMLRLQDGDAERSVEIAYTGGLKYPHLVRDPAVKDRLSAMLAPR